MRVRIIDDGGESDRRRVIEAALREQCQTLRLPVTMLGDGDASWPGDDFVVFLGGEAASTVPADRIAMVERQAEEHGRVLPVLRHSEHAAFLPGTLGRINALIESRYGDEWPHAVVDEILSRLLLRRTDRKVFISYRRADSLAIARQLHDELSRLGFQVFLDEADIEPSIAFQPALEAELVDADLVLVLASPRFEQSKWTVREISMAGAANVGMLALAWPGALYGDRAAVSFAGTRGWDRPSVMGTAGLGDEDDELELTDLVAPEHGRVDQALDQAPERVRLTAEAVERLVGAALRARMRATRARLENVLGSAEVALRGLGQVGALGARGDLVLAAADGRVLVRVVPFRPTPRTLHDVWRDARADGYAAAAVYYSELADMNAPDVQVLRWLSDAMHAKPTSQARVYIEVGAKVRP